MGSEVDSRGNIPMCTGTGDLPPLVRPGGRDVRLVNHDFGSVKNIIQETIQLIAVLNNSVVSGIRIQLDVPGVQTALDSVNGVANRL